MSSNGPEQKPVWTATEALTWLAFGTPETWEQFMGWVRGFCEQWRSAPPAHDVEQLLDAIGAAEPSYPWRPQLSDDRRKVIGYETAFAAPSRLINESYGSFKTGAPELARAIRGEHRRRLGRLVTYRELRVMLAADLNECRRRDLEWNVAHKRLRDAILQEQLVAWGVRERDPKQEHIPVPPQVAFRAIQFREDFIEPDNGAPSEDRIAILNSERWVQVRFRSAEVIALLAVSKTGIPVAKQKIRGLDYATADAPLVEEALLGMKTKKYRNATDAARALAGRAEGMSLGESKMKRLLGRILSRSAPFSPEQN